MTSKPLSVCWALLTMGDRPEALAAAVSSIHDATVGDDVDVVIVLNGAASDAAVPGCRTIQLPANVGIPGGRHAAMTMTGADIVFFLDDDARVVGDWPARIVSRFAVEDRLAVVSMRLVDEQGDTSRRHVPRIGRSGLDRAGPVPTFLGGASAIRRTAYAAAGGYWEALWYGHEELDLSWRLIDIGWAVRYEPDATVFHPRTTITRHASGWWYTGRNRVWVARRDLPWPVALLHTVCWLLLGIGRAPAGECRRSYVAGWWTGWRGNEWGAVRRRPISWTSVWQLTRLGRPPIV